MIRNSHMNVETLHAELSKTHAHRRMICVPVDVPGTYVRYLKSAASRSFGPNEEEKSGVDFTMHTIGRSSSGSRRKKKTRWTETRRRREPETSKTTESRTRLKTI